MGKSVLITGCTPGGIGHALAREFRARGSHVIATGRTASKIHVLEEEGIDCVSLVVDDPVSVAKCHKTVKTLLRGKGLDFLINNAGRTVIRPAAETDLAEAKGIFAANVLAVIDITQMFLPELITAGGVVVNIGSVASHLPVPYMAVYNASKAALYAYSETLRLEVAPLGVKVTHIQTGNVTTNGFEGNITVLEDKSQWIAAREEFNKRQELAATSGSSPEVFAKALVSGLVSGYKKVRWVGDGAFIVRVALAIQNWFPFDILSFMLTKMYGLDKVRRP